MIIISGEESIQGSPEWLSGRTKYLGCSEASTALGLSPWKTPQELYLEKTTGIVPDNSSKQFIFEKGHRGEKIAREKYEELTNMKFPPRVIRNSNYPFLQASLDGLSDDLELIEIKYLGTDKWLDVSLNGKVPEHYKTQVQFQMALANLDIMTFIGINDNDEIAVCKVVRDSEFINASYEKLNTFWQKVLNKEPIEEIEYIEDDSLSSLMEKYLNVSDEIKSLTEIKEQIKEAIQLLAKSDKFTCGKFSYSKSTRQGQINYSKIPILKTMSLEEFRGPPATIIKIGVLNGR